MTVASPRIRSAADALRALQDFPAFAETGLAMRAITADSQGGFRSYKLQLTSRAQTELAAIAESSRADALEKTPLEYAPAVLVPPGHVMHVADDDAATMTQILETVERDDSAPYSDVPPGTTIRLLAFRFTADDGRRVVFFRVADTLSQLKSNKMLALLRDDGVYDKLEPADVMLLRRSFDVVHVDTFAFFTQKPTFERAFGFLDQLRASSAATFATVTAHLRIKGMDKMRAACMKQTQMMAKMASIDRSMSADPEYADAMTMDRLVPFVRERDYIDVDVVSEDGKDYLVYQDDVVHRFQILKLLDDDYLRSVLTERDYESGSKTRPSANSE